MSLAAGIIGGIGAAGSLGGAAIASSGAQNAASTQAQASNEAAQLQYQLGEQNLGFQQQVYNQQQQNIAPWLQSGQGALGTLDQLLGINAPVQGGAPAQAQVPMGLPIIPGGPDPFTTGGGQFSFPGGTQAAPSQARQSGLNPNSPLRTGTGLRGTLNNPVGSLSSLSQGGSNTLVPTSLFQPWSQQFQAPTLQQAQQYPGYQFQLQQGLQSLQNSAAARGGLLSGATGEALQQYGQGLAQSDYQNVYNQALGQYQQNYDIFQQNQNNLFNRYASLAGLGQTAAGQLNAAGSNAAGNVGNTLTNIGGQVGQSLQAAGAAQASGYAAGGNIWGNATSQLGNLPGSLYGLSQLANLGNTGGGYTPGSIPGY